MQRRGVAVIAVAACLGCLVACSGVVGGASSASPPISTAAGSGVVTPAAAATAGRRKTGFHAAMRRLAKSTPGRFSVAGEEIDTGRTLHFDPGLRAYAASIVKVPVLLAVLRHDRAAGHGLTARQSALAKRMIERSDNDATTSLWRKGGDYRGLFALFHALGTDGTRRAPTLYEPWDGVTTSAADQITILHGLWLGVPGLHRRDGHTVRRLMAHVESDQRWGVPAGASRGWNTFVKDGWVPVSHSGWTVNTIGIGHRRHRTYALAILSTGQPSEAAGISTVSRVARVATRYLRSRSRQAHRTQPAAPDSSARPLAGQTIAIDPGHNGDNFAHPDEINRMIWNGREWEHCNTTGTETDGGYPEAEINFHVAEYLRADLLQQGAHVVMTRTNNHGVGPCVNRRAAIISASHAVAAVAIHGDGGPADGRGFAILLPVADGPNDAIIKPSVRLGRDLRATFRAETKMPISTYDGTDGFAYRDDLAGLNLVRVPEVLIECGNMRNATDARLMTSRSFQRSAAHAMLDAFIRFARQAAASPS